MQDRDTRYSPRGMVDLDNTSIGGKRETGKRGRGAVSKVPVMRAVESRPKGCGHITLRKVASVTSSQIQRFLTHNGKGDTLILSVGLPVYQSLSQSRTLYPLSLESGQRAVEVFADVRRVIVRLNTWIQGTHSHVSKNTLTATYRNFRIVLIGGSNSAASPSSTGWLQLAVQQRRLRIANWLVIYVDKSILQCCLLT